MLPILFNAALLMAEDFLIVKGFRRVGGDNCCVEWGLLKTGNLELSSDEAERCPMSSWCSHAVLCRAMPV